MELGAELLAFVKVRICCTHAAWERYSSTGVLSLYMRNSRRYSQPVLIIYALFFSTAKDCGNLSVPLNGSFSGRETIFPNEVTFSCDEGFILNGSRVRHCQSNGSWSGIETSCTGRISSEQFLDSSLCKPC